ncbi:MAG: glycine cleavage system protein GcvH [Opitutales bacterium]
MSNLPSDLRYTKDHEWLRLESDGTATVGITDHAQAALGDVTFVDLPKIGATFAEHATFGTVESVKAASDLYCPVAGTIVAVNADLNNSPDLVNREPYTGAWMIRIKLDNPAAAQGLLTAAQYQALL